MSDYYYTLIKDIIENNEKEKAIKIIANKLNKKQISGEKEILTNLEKDKEIERLNNIINELERYINEEYIYDELGMKIFDASKLQDKLQELKGDDSNE